MLAPQYFFGYKVEDWVHIGKQEDETVISYSIFNKQVTGLVFLNFELEFRNHP